MADSERDLEALFGVARREHDTLPDALKQRMLTDAARIQRGLAPASPTRTRRPRWWGQLSQMLGGWYGLGGLATACAAGVWLGFAPPSSLPNPVDILVQSDTTYDLFEADGLAMAMLEDI